MVIETTSVLYNVPLSHEDDGNTARYRVPHAVVLFGRPLVFIYADPSSLWTVKFA
jgi:hypothetical protein